MASSSMESVKNLLERVESRKAHAWWWESHVNPKNAKWLATSLAEMELSTAQMVELIENDGDTLVRKAEMYFERRPKLVNQIHEFQRMYRKLAERYKQLTGDLHTNLSEMNLIGPMTPDSDSEPGTPRVSTDVKSNPFKTNHHRAAGFEYFLSSNSGRYVREVSPAPVLEDSDFNNFPRSMLLPEKQITVDTDLGNAKDKTGMVNPALAELQLKIASYEVEIGKLKKELENARSSNNKPKIEEQEVDARHIQVEVEGSSDLEKVRAMHEELKLTEARLLNLEMENERLSTENKLAHENIKELQEQLHQAQKDATKYDTEELTNESDLLQEQLNGLKRRCHVLETQKEVVKKNLSEEIKQLEIELTKKRERLEELNSKYVTLTSERDALIAEAGLCKDLKLQVERQKELALEAEEQKLEAIRQLCYALEHYRRGYKQLREARLHRRTEEIGLTDADCLGSS